jgi:glucan phosphoethanolaminetransferase (alkaline phosphatase superfamily)
MDPRLPPSQIPELDEAAYDAYNRQGEAESRRVITIIIVVLVIVMAALAATFIALLRANSETVSQIRDVFIVFLALQSLLIGLAMIILMVQLARLINLLQNEIRPIIDSTNETVSNLRGTTTFLSDNLVEPVIRLNEYLAGLNELLRMLGVSRRPPRS